MDSHVRDSYTHPFLRDAVDIIAFEHELECETVSNTSIRTDNVILNSSDSTCNCNAASRVVLRSVARGTTTRDNEQSINRSNPRSRCNLSSNNHTESSTTRTFANLLNVLTSKLPSMTAPHVEVELMVYDAQAGTATARLSASSTAPLTLLFDSIPCTTTSASSALLFVNNTLYEYSHPSCSDYSTPIANFIAIHNGPSLPSPTIHRFTTTDDAPKVRELRPKLGQPYVYIHDKDCEHRVIFTDVRSARSNSAEPGQVRLVSRWAPRVQACDLCHMRVANVAVFNDELAPCSPIHYCNQCYERLHPESSERAQLKSVEHPKLIADQVGRR